MNPPAPPPPIGLYAHFPWCVRKCPYCDFNSHPLKEPLREAEYLSTLLDDLRRELKGLGERPIETIYFGGGTPSIFSPDTFRTLLEAIPAAATEVTLEANPGAAENAFADYRRAGITRISLGAQSFDPVQLRRLGRIHAADDSRRAAGEIAAAGFTSFNIDLMYGLPDQDVAAALDDLVQAIRLEPPHISWYQLTIEPKTEFARHPPRVPDPDQLAAIEDAGLELLASHGYQRYEVSAFARDDQHCAHNLNYWRFGDYLGIGAGAHGKLTSDGTVARTAKPDQPRRYLRGDGARTAILPPASLPAEFMMNALRLTDGVHRELFQARTGQAFSAIASTVAELVDWGLMRRDRLALTAQGYRQLDSVVARFL